MSEVDPRPSGGGGRNDVIDALRGLAIVLVVLNHLGLRIPLKHTWASTILPDWLMRALNWNGYEAVFVFFVISGFVITRQVLVKQGALSRIGPKLFYARRAARILPCLLALLAVLSLLHGLGWAGYRIDRPGQSLSGALTAALGLHLNWYEGMTGYLPANWDVLWSLSIEETFYLVFPLVCVSLRQTKWLVALLLGLALSMPWIHAALRGNEIWQEKAYWPGMGAIAIGVLAALGAGSWQPRRRLTSMLLGMAGAIGLLLVFCAGKLVWTSLRDGYLLLLCVAAACVLVAAVQRQPLGSSWRGLGWLRGWGRRSYEIYLSHMFVILPLVGWFKSSGLPGASGLLCYPVAWWLCGVLGTTIERGWSTPARRWLDRRWQLDYPICDSAGAAGTSVTSERG